MKEYQKEHQQVFVELCGSTRSLIKEQKYKECEALLSGAMLENPHSPILHNLLGIVLAKENRCVEAMKHFRASHMLDPNYLPARHNLKNLGTFYQVCSFAFDESDCYAQANQYTIEYDERGIGRAVRGG